MAMADDVFKHIGWLYSIGLRETSKIIGLGRGMVSLSVNGALVFDYNEQLD